MIDQVIKRILERLKSEITAFVDEFDDEQSASLTQNHTGTLVDSVRGHLGRLAAEEHQISKQLRAADKDLSEIEHKIEVAINEGREDLARAALIRKHGLRRQIDHLDARFQDITQESLEVEQLISDLSEQNTLEGQSKLTSTPAALRAKLDELDALMKTRERRTTTPAYLSRCRICTARTTARSRNPQSVSVGSDCTRASRAGTRSRASKNCRATPSPRVSHCRRQSGTGTRH